VDYLATGETLTLTYTIQVEDSQGATDTQTVVITVNGTADTPEIAGGPDSVGLTETDSGLTSSGTFTVTDLDRTDNVTAAVDSVSVGGTGSSSVPGYLTNATLRGYLTVSPTAILDGTETTDTLNWSFNSGSEPFDFLADGETLVLTYTVRATDDDATPRSDTEIVTVTITGSNDGPNAISDNNIAVEAGGVGNGSGAVNPTGNALSNDNDLDVSDSLSVVGVSAGIHVSTSGSINTAVPGLYGAITLQSNGTYTYAVDNSNPLVQALIGSGDTLSDVFTYTVSDNIGLTSTAQIYITIQGANDNPDDLTATGMIIAENSANSTLVGAITPSDVDVGESFTYDLIDDAAGRFSIDGSGVIRVLDTTRLDFEDTSSHNITVEVTDLAGATYSETFVVNLTDVDEFDVTTPLDGDATLNEVDENSIGVAVGVTAYAVDNDGTTNLVTYMLIDDAGGRFAIDSTTGIVTAVGNLDFETSVSHTITVQADSQDGSQSSQSFVIAVNDINEAPIAADDRYDTFAGQAISLSAPEPTANDVDVDGDLLSVVIVTQPSHGTLTVDSMGVVTYTPDIGFFGEDTFEYRASDGALQSAGTATVTIDVQAGGDGGNSDDGADTGDDNSSDTDTPDDNTDANDPDTDSPASEDAQGDNGGWIEEGVINDDESPSRSQSDDESATMGGGSSEESTVALGVISERLVASSSSEAMTIEGLMGSSLSRSTQTGSADQLSEMLFRATRDSLLAWQYDEDVEERERQSMDYRDLTIGAVGTTLGLASVGYVFWALRGGVFLATIYAGLPTWRALDPASLLTAYRNGPSNDRIEKMMQNGKSDLK
ncbi:MAG: Ig-like domain-containing protein, partial [Planctomycetota bacterium]